MRELQEMVLIFGLTRSFKKNALITDDQIHQMYILQ